MKAEKEETSWLLDIVGKGILFQIGSFFYFSWIIAMVHQNSPTVEFWQEKIEGNLGRANTEIRKYGNRM